jgi:D-alanine-D-alanine ligase
MPVDIDPSDLNVLLLYNLDPAWTSREKEEVVSVSARLYQALSDIGHPTTLLPLETADLASALKPFDPLSYLVFNWCEGLPGISHSEYLVAQCLESLGFAFTGAGSKALALSQDKRRVMEILVQSRIPIPAWRVYATPDAGDWHLFPAIVKPVNEHCSEGVTRDSVVMTETELTRRIDYILRTYRQAALVEDFIDGREFHVSLWGNGRIEMLPPAEMDFSLFADIHDRLCTYDAKFVPGSPHYEGIKTLLPAPLNAKEIRDIEEVCRSAYQALGCRDYGRIDLRMRDGVFYALDINPNADISYDASLACSAEAAGFSYGQTGSRIIRLAARRHPGWGRIGAEPVKIKKCAG